MTARAPEPGAEVATRVTVRSTLAPMLGEPRVSSGQIAQLLRGHQADVLDEEGVWWRIMGADGYAGWCHRGYLEPEWSVLPPPPLRAAWSTERRMSIGCRVRRSDGTQLSLPLGALLEPDEDVVHGLAMNHRARARYFAPDVALLARRAVECFRGTPYQWGGVSPWGADCSGFVQTMYALHGTQLPRDAWMQAERGHEVNGEFGDLVAGDLLFFSDRDDGRITHVALSLGGAAIVHSSLANGGFGINQLDASDAVATALRTTFRFARRIL